MNACTTRVPLLQSASTGTHEVEGGTSQQASCHNNPHPDAVATVALIPQLVSLQQNSHSIGPSSKAATKPPLPLLLTLLLHKIFGITTAAAAAAKQALPAAGQQASPPAAPAKLLAPHALLPVSWIARVQANCWLCGQAARRLAHSPYAVSVVVSISSLINTWATDGSRWQALLLLLLCWLLLCWLLCICQQ
jgi:hypothetical protein